jgi:uncharacterized repeat protein (TIGR01451 family)
MRPINFPLTWPSLIITGKFLLACLLLGIAIILTPAQTAYAHHDYEGYVTDDAGADDEPGQKDLNSLAVDYSHIDTDNQLWVKWTWDIDSLSGNNSADGCVIFDTDGDGLANYMLCNFWRQNQQQVAGSPLLYVCNDQDTDNCGGNATTQPLSTGTSCSISNVPDAFGGRGGAQASTVNDTQSTCVVNLADINSGQVTNICSYPSGQPTSDPSDCVFQPNTTAFLEIVKTAGGDTTTPFNFSLSPAARDGSSSFTVNGGETSSLIRITSGTSYQLSEVNLPSGWQLNTAQCTVNGQNVGTFQSSSNSISGINLSTGQTVTCTFSNSLQPGKIIVVKQTTPDGASQPFTFTPSWNNGASFALSDGQSHDSGALAAGTYTVSEALPAGWSQTSATCSDGSSPTQIQLSAGETITCTFNNDLLPSAIGLVKTANQTLINAGQSVTYQYAVTNQGQTPLSTVSVSDDKCSPVTPSLNGAFNVGDTDQDTFLEAGEAWQFVCTTPLTADTLNIATAQGQNPVGALVTATDMAFVDVRPTISVAKSANPTSVAETGGAVQFTVNVTNNSGEAVTLTALTDSIYGNLDLQGTCGLPQTLAANGGSYSCSFSQVVSGNVGGPNHQNVVTATASDDENNQTTAQDDAVVSFTDVLPGVELTKTANPTTLAEPDGVFTFTLTIKNTSNEAAIITALADTYALSPACNALINTTIAGQGEVSCTYTVSLSNPGSYTNTASVTVRDDENNSASASAQATVTVTNVPSALQVSKSANPTTLVEPGGQVQFTVRITNTSAVDTVSLTSILDDTDNNGVNDVNYTAADICNTTVLAPGAVAVCTFTHNLTGNAGTLLTDTATALGIDDDQQPVSASDDATVAILNASAELLVSKRANPTSLAEPGGQVVFTIQLTNTSTADVLTINQMQDSIYQDVTTSGHDGIVSTTCAVPQTLAANGGSYTCQFVAVVAGQAYTQHENVIVATGVDDDGEKISGADNAQVELTNLPSSIQVSKRANPIQVPESGGNVSYTVVVTNTSSADTVFIQQVVDDRFGDVSSSCAASLPATLTPNATLTCTFTRFIQGNAGTTHINTVMASGYDDEEGAVEGSANATVTFTDTPALLTVTKSANPTVVPETGGTVEYTVLIKNDSVADTIGVTAVDDDRFGDVRTGCLPDLPVALVPGQTMTCTFSRFVQGDVEEQHVNVVIVKGVDDDGNNVTASDQETVTFSNVPAAMTVSKTPSVDGVPATGAVVEFTVRVENTSAIDSLTLTSLADSIYGNVTSASNPALVTTTCSLPQTVPSGQFYECRFSALLAGAIGDVHTNLITAQATDDDGGPLTGSADATVLLAGSQIEATKDDTLLNDANGNGIANPGEILEYTIVIRNTGNAAGVYTFTDLPDANTTLVNGTVTTSQGTVTTGNQPGEASVVVQLGSIAAESAVTVKFQVRVNNPLPAQVTKVTNQGLITGDSPAKPTDDPDTLQPNDPTVTPVVASPVLTSIKTDKLLVDADQNNIASPGDLLEYRITIANIGNQTATGVTLEDTPDSNTALVPGSVQTSAGSVATGNSVGDNHIQINISAIEGGASVVITFQVKINQPLLATVTRVANQGILTSQEQPPVLTDDPDTPQPDDPTVTPVRAEPVLSASKRVALFADADNNRFASSGDTLLYEITIRNSGNAPATGLLFSDTVDINTRLVPNSVQTSQGTILGGNNLGERVVRVALGDLNPAGELVITYRVTINNPLPAGVAEVINQGVVESNEVTDLPTDDPTKPGAEDPTTQPVGITPKLQITKQDRLFTDADGNKAVSHGDTLLYILTIANTSNGTAENVIFTDTPDAHTTLVNSSIQSSQGVITQGNTQGDEQIRVELGSLPPGAIVTIGFRVTIDEDAGNYVANQAVITYRGTGPSNTSGGETLSDDPDTSEVNDPTVTPVINTPTALDETVEPGLGGSSTEIFLPLISR